MKIDVMQECCMALEAAEVIARQVNREGYQETKNKILMRYGARFSKEDRQKFTERMDAISGAFDRIKDVLPTGPETEFLFRKHYYNNTWSILAQIMLINFHDIRKHAIRDYLRAAKERWNKTMDARVSLKAASFSALLLVPGERTLRESLLDDIDRLNDPYEFKWDLFKVLTNFEYYAGCLERMFLQIEQPLGEALALLNPIADEMKSFWEEKLTLPMLEEMAESMGLPRENVRNKKVILQLLRMSCDQAIIDDQWSGSMLPVYLGLGIDWGNQFEDDQIDRSLLCGKLKVLSEDSKFEILRLIKNEGSYGQEIARKLQLDAATVSRHLTVLQRCGLVSIERKEGRNIYYRTNQNEIRYILELMQKIFL